jgi:hypothetical protein
MRLRRGCVGVGSDAGEIAREEIEDECAWKRKVSVNVVLDGADELDVEVEGNVAVRPWRTRS